MNNITKLALSIVVTIIATLLVPVFGQWYEQQTGINPVAFYTVSSLIGVMNIMYRVIIVIEENS